MSLIERPRRLRRTPLIRDLVRETQLSANDLIQPYFVSATAAAPEPIGSMPGRSRHTLGSLVDACRQARLQGVKVLLFGLPESKDAQGHGADAADGIVQQAVRALREAALDLVIMTDVCLCEYTDHGHCGLLEEEIVTDSPDRARRRGG